ncbi:MAG: malectin domain-containing carbohydrate-binding protein [Bryobacteraceae bacterium]
MRSALLAVSATLLLTGTLLAQPTIGNLNPNGGSGNGFTFSLTVSDSAAATNIGFTELLFNNSLDGTNACYLRYDQTGGVIYLRDDANPAWVDSGAPGSTAILANSQCSVNLAASSATALGTNLTLTVALSFTPAFAGAKNIYAQAGTDTLTTDWQNVGSWTVTAPSSSISVSLTPTSITLGPTQTQEFIATVTGDPANAVNWSITPSTLGLISNTGLYTAPPAVSAQQTVSVRATSAADPTRFAAAIVTLTPPPPGARPITIYNTGVLSPGVLAQQGSADPHYTLIASADAGFPGPNAFIVINQSPIGAYWLAWGPQSNWIGPQAAAANGNPPGTYTYRTTFDLTGLDPTTAGLTGNFASDNNASIRLNGAPAGPNSLSSSAYTPFTINSGFVAGVNTLDFVVVNGGPLANPTGLRVEISGSASPLASGVSVTVNPGTQNAYPSQTLQFAASVTGSTNTAVTWTVTPAVGSISSTGVYTAPASITSQQLLTIRATSAADPTRSGIAYLMLNQPAGALAPIRINSGGEAYTNPQGRLWSADYGFTGIGGAQNSSTPCTATDASPLYQSTRYGDVAYTLNVPNGTYAVTLKFCEPYLSGPGRVSNASINGTVVLQNFDILVAAGGQNIAVDRTINVTVTNHQLVIQNVVVQYGPLISAIEIIQTSAAVDVQISEGPVSLTANQTKQFTATVTGTPNTLVNWSISPAGAGSITANGLYTAPASIGAQQIVTVQATSAADPTRVATVFVTLNPPVTTFVPIRINAGGSAFTDATGKQWSADYGFVNPYGGGNAISSNAVSGATNPTLYQSVHWGETTYTFPVPNGAYSVTLKFAELFYTGPGRVFNVSINGTQVLANFDIFVAGSGQNIAVDRTFTANVTNGQTVIALGYGAIVSGIEISTQAGPSILSMTPASAQPGQTVSVAINGQSTNFVAGTTVASFGAGTSVGGAADGAFGLVTVTSATTARASVQISPSAAPGARTVAVMTGSEAVSLPGGFTIVAPLVNLSGATPNPAQAGTSSVTVTAANFPSGTITASAITVLLEPATAGAGPTASTQATSITTPVNGTLQVTFVLPSSITVVAPTQYLISISGQTSTTPFGTATKASLVMNPGASLSSVSPNSGPAGQLVSVTITGNGSHFVQGVTQANFGNGITVGSTVNGNDGNFGTVNVISPTSATAQVKINNTATVGARSVTVRTGTEQVSFLNAFTVAPPLNLPLLTITSPAPSTIISTSAISVVGTINDPTATVVVNGLSATNSGGTFTAGNVPLKEGSNLITATATNTQGYASSATVSVVSDTVPPIVVIDTPTNNAMVTSSTITVAGMINDIVSGTVNGSQATVTVNGILATVSNRSFMIQDFLLLNGANTITVVARDRAGNQAQSQKTVTLMGSGAQQRIQMISGNNQTGVIESTLPQPLIVGLLDAFGRPQTNRPVTFTVRRSDGTLRQGTQQGQKIIVSSDANGRASVTFTLGSRAGVGGNQVAVTSPGFTNEAIFSASSTVSTPDVIIAVHGEGQRGIVGTRLPHPFEVIVFDKGGNPVVNVPVTFTVKQGGGNLGGLSVLTVGTNEDGKSSTNLTLGLQEGLNNNVVVATFPSSVRPPAAFTASGFVPGSPTSTRVSGVVLDNSDRPIPNVTVKIVGTPLTTVTDSSGRFSIANAPVGSLEIIADGRTSTRQETFPFLAFHLFAIPGLDNTLGHPMYLPPLNVENSKTVGGSQDVVLTMRGVPGVAFTVVANSAYFPDGSRIGQMSLSQVHSDKVPHPPPNGSAPRIVWTLQPAGVRFDPPIRVQLPNTEGALPGEVTEIFQSDHDLEQFVSVGMARVSGDGSIIVSDPGFGITKSGWGAPRRRTPTPTCVSLCDRGNPCETYTCLEEGVCFYFPQPNGVPCDNTGSQCGACHNGVCVANQPSGTACNDNNSCTSNDACTSTTVL